MIKSFLSWSVASLMLCSGFITSCSDDPAEPIGGEVIPPPNPTVEITPGEVTATSLKFTLTLTDADKCNYICTKATDTAPAVDAIVAEGKSVTASGIIEITGLESGVKYRLSAVASKGKFHGPVKSTEHDTFLNPAVTLTAETVTATGLSFTATLVNPETAAYVCVEKTADLVVPTAQEILSSGTAITQSGKIDVTGLRSATTYVIAAAVAKSGVYSEVGKIEMTTDTDITGPATFTTQALGGYYGVPSGKYSGEYRVVLSDGPAVETDGVYATTGRGRALSMDLYQATPSNLSNIVLPARNYGYALSKTISTFHPDLTYCMVNDGKGNISRVNFNAGEIVVKYVAATMIFTITATLTTTTGETFTASYVGPIKIEDKTSSEKPSLPSLKKDVTNITFIRALAKYYTNSASADHCILHLYDVQPGGADGSDYLNTAGHLVSLDLSTAISTQPVLQEGVYNVNDAGTAGSYYPGKETVFMDTLLATGTYCEEMDSNRLSAYGLISTGTVTITKVSSGYRFVLNMTTDKGYKISGTYEGNVEMIDRR